MKIIKISPGVLNKHWNYYSYLIKDTLVDVHRNVSYDQDVHLVGLAKYSYWSVTSPFVKSSVICSNRRQWATPLSYATTPGDGHTGRLYKTNAEFLDAWMPGKLPLSSKLPYCHLTRNLKYATAHQPKSIIFYCLTEIVGRTAYKWIKNGNRTTQSS